MGKEKYPELDLMACCYEDFLLRFRALGLENFKGDLVEKIEALEDETVKEFLMTFNDFEQKDKSSISFALTPDHELVRDNDLKFAFLVRNNLLHDKIILQRDHDLFYGFLPEDHRGLTLLEHAISKHHFELSKAIAVRLKNIDQSKLSNEEKKILASQIDLYNYYEDSISRKVKIPELDVFPRTYTYRKALSEGSAELQEALIAAAMPFNLGTIKYGINPEGYEEALIAAAMPFNLGTIKYDMNPEGYKQAVNAYDYLMEESTEKLIEVFKSSRLTALDLAHITNNHILHCQFISSQSGLPEDLLNAMRIEYLSRVDPKRLCEELKQIQDEKKRDDVIKEVLSIARNTNRLDIMDMIIYDFLKGKIKITSQSLLDLMFVSCAGLKPKNPEVLAEYTAYLRGDTSIRKYDTETLELSAQKLQIQILQHLISNFGVKIDVEGQLKQTALGSAAERGYLDVVKFCIDKGANLDLRGFYDRTALMKAAEKGYLDVAKELIAKGANMDLQNRFHSTVLINAVARGYLDLVKELVAKGANLDVQDGDGRTVLMWVVARGYLDLAKELVAKGVNLDVQDRDGRTVLMWVVERGYLDVAKELIAKGANLEVQDRDGRTALMKAAEKGYLDVAKELIAKGANLDLKGRDGRTALSYALGEGKDDIAKLLIIGGYHINGKQYKYLNSEIKKIVKKVKKDGSNPKLRELRYVKEGLESVSQYDALKEKKELFEGEMKGQGLTIHKLYDELIDKRLDKKALFESLGLDVKDFDQIQINKLIKSATKIIAKGLETKTEYMETKTDPKLVVNQLAEKLVIKVEMMRIREKPSFASKLYNKVLGRWASR